jgi:AcrR family transcriptional regulator
MAEAKRSPSTSKTALADTVPEGTAQRRRGRPRQGKAVARHLPRDEEILEIAAEVFFARGFDGAKLDHIAEAAGIVKGSLYHYFESKEEIYARLIQRIVELVPAEEVISGEEPADERLVRLIRPQIELVARNPVEVGILMRQLLHLEGEVGAWARDYRRRYVNALRQVIAQGQRSRVFRPGDPDALAAFIHGSITVLSEWYRPGGRLDTETIVEELSAFILTGVGAKVRR